MSIPPDICFQDKDALLSIVKCVNNLDDSRIIGVARATKGNDGKIEILTTIIHGNDRESAENSIHYSMEVKTIDECMFIIKRVTSVSILLPKEIVGICIRLSIV